MPMPQKWWLVKEEVVVSRVYRVSAPTPASAVLSAKGGEDEKPDVVELEHTRKWYHPQQEGEDADT